MTKVRMGSERFLLPSSAPANHSQTVVNNTDAAFAVIDETGRILFLNEFPQVFQDLLFKPLHTGESIIDAVPVLWREMAKNILNNVVTTRAPSSVGVHGLDRAGARLFFELSCKPIKDEGDRVSRMLIEAKDVTLQRIFEEKLSSVTSELSNLVEHATAVIVGTDSRGCITEWNDMSAEVTGYTKSQAITRKLVELMLDVDEQSGFAIALQGVMENKPLVNHELKVRAKDDRKLTFLINGNPKRNSAGEVIGILLIGQDITELIDYRNSLEVKVEARTRALNESNRVIQLQKEIVEKEREKSDQLLLNILPKEVATELKETGKVLPRHYAETSILFADLVGFTTMSAALDAEELLRELNYICVGFDFIVERNNMEKIKSIGDGYFAVAGIPVRNLTNAVDAVNAGLEMIEFIARIRRENEKSSRPPWRLRVGINTGGLIAGVIGKSKFAYDVWGVSVNIASRMESAGIVDKVNISESTYHLVKDQFVCNYRGSIEVKSMGKKDMYIVERKSVTPAIVKTSL